MSESQTGFHGYQFDMLKTEADIERIRCERRAEETETFFILGLCVLYEAEDKVEHRERKKT
jgi:hypothetical protein